MEWKVLFLFLFPAWGKSCQERTYVPPTGELKKCPIPPPKLGRMSSDPSAEVVLYARDGMECIEQENVCIAMGGAWVQKQDLTVWGNQIKAHFMGKKRKRILVSFEAVGNVRATHPSGVIVGDHLWYEVGKEIIQVRGKAISLQTKDYRLTAKELLRYSHKINQAEALGDVCLCQGDAGLRAEQVTASFQTRTLGPHVLSSQPQSLSLRWARGTGNVRIWKADQLGSGDRGFYDAMAQKAYFWGHVSMSQGKDFARCEEGVVDLRGKNAQLLGKNGLVYFLLHPTNFKKAKKL